MSHERDEQPRNIYYEIHGDLKASQKLVLSASFNIFFPEGLSHPSLQELIKILFSGLSVSNYPFEKSWVRHFYQSDCEIFPATDLLLLG
jgi:hypothetical protein